MARINIQRLGINRTVFTLGIVSMLTDISSEGIYPLIPLFLTNVLHAQVTAVGLIEGIAESAASILRVFSGWFSDIVRNRKWVTTAGYVLSTISKPLFAVSTSWQQVFMIRFADRVGKGVRSAPRDALIADVTPAESRGISFGFHRAMDTAGAVTGPLLALWLLRSLHFEFRTIFLLSAVPAILAVLILIAFVREPPRVREAHEERPSLSLSALSPRYKMFLSVVVIFSLGNFSNAFLILRAQNVGVATGNILLLYVLFNGVAATLSTSAGAISDRFGRRNVILVGFLVFSAVYMGFGLVTEPAAIWVLFAFYGLYSALTSGVQKAFAADLINPGMRGTGLGVYYTLTGLALLPANVIAGYLWDTVNPSAPFFYGAAMALIAAFLLILFFRGSVIYTDT